MGFLGFILLLLILLALPSRARADLDPERAQPYRLQVVLHFAEHRALTRIFREQVQRELQDNLQAALQGLAEVSIVTAHPQLKDMESNGLQRGLDSWKNVSGDKTHFVLIDFVDGRYEIQARQHDGFTGLASPVVRRTETADRQLVARQIALLIQQDFGIVGTLGKKENDRIEVQLKGGDLGVPLEEWVKTGDVFAIAQILKQGTGGKVSYRMPWTLLQATDAPRNGVCPCRLCYRLDNPLPSSPGVLGYRCLKLATAEGPVRLRLLDAGAAATPLIGKGVRVSAEGFDGAVRETLATNSDGRVKTEHTYRSIAFVVILEGMEARARVPVEIVDDRTVTVRVSIDPEAERRSQLLVHRRRWIQRIYDSLEVTATVVRELNGLVTTSPREQTLERAQAGLKGLESDIANYLNEGENLRKEAAELKELKKPLDLSEGERRLKDLQARKKELESFIKGLEGIVQEEKDPKRQKWKELAAQARLAETEADFDQAIKLYEQIIATGGDDPAVRKHLEELKRAWKPKSADHEKARTFIYKIWPKQETAAQMMANMEALRDAVEVCKKAGDRLTLLMFRKTNIVHATRLSKEFESLHPDKEDDRKTLETIPKVTAKLTELDNQAAQFLEGSKPASE